MSWARALGCGTALACLLVAGSASANEFIPSISIQSGVSATRTAGGNGDDYFVAATPQLAYFIEGERKLVSVTYAFTGSLNTFLPNAVANRLEIASAWEVAPRTRLLFSVEGLQALLGNYLLVRRTAGAAVGGVNNFNTSLLTVTLNQGILHELSPRLRLTQTATASHVTSLDEAVKLDNTLAAASLTLERAWDFNAVGANLTVQYAKTDFPPLLSTIYTAAFGPTWDHDFTANWSMSLSAAGQVAASGDANLGARFAPSGSAGIGYGSRSSGFGLEYAGGIEPNLILGTLLQSHQVTLRAGIPLSEKNKVLFGVSAGYLKAQTLDLDESGAQDSKFDAVLHDAELTYDPLEILRLSMRYQFIGQTAGEGNLPIPAIVRHAVIFGIDLFGSRPGGRPRAIPRGFSNRADGNDPSAPAGKGAFSSGVAPVGATSSGNSNANPVSGTSFGGSTAPP